MPTTGLWRFIQAGQAILCPTKWPEAGEFVAIHCRAAGTKKPRQANRPGQRSLLAWCGGHK
jgi:hypothetical protein